MKLQNMIIDDRIDISKESINDIVKKSLVEIQDNNKIILYGRKDLTILTQVMIATFNPMIEKKDDNMIIVGIQIDDNDYKCMIANIAFDVRDRSKYRVEFKIIK